MRYHASTRPGGLLRPAGAVLLAPGFTLIELLVVISIIAVLIGILLPVLAGVRSQARVAACAANLRQCGMAVTAYATDHAKALPTGPATGNDSSVGTSWAKTMTSLIWIGDASDYGAPNTPQRQYNSLGRLLERDYLTDKRAIYCPGDPTNDPAQEQAKVGTGRDAYGSYLYRQLMETTGNHLDHLGVNSLGHDVQFLAMDRQSQITAIPSGVQTNHDNKVVNILFLDGRVTTIVQKNNRLAITNAYLGDPPGTLAKLIQNADWLLAGAIDTVPNP